MWVLEEVLAYFTDWTVDDWIAFVALLVGAPLAVFSGWCYASLIMWGLGIG